MTDNAVPAVPVPPVVRKASNEHLLHSPNKEPVFANSGKALVDWYLS